MVGKPTNRGGLRPMNTLAYGGGEKKIKRVRAAEWPDEKDGEAMITALHHIAIIVSSEESLAFYRLLGFQETFRKKRKYDTAVLMDGYGMQLEIFIDPSHPGRGDQEPMGLRHFALRVEKLEDEIERLKGAGIEIGPVMEDWTGVRFCFVKDFDGLLVELHE